MDMIDEVLTDHLLDESDLEPSVRAAMNLAKKTMNRYYNKTDKSDCFRIGMSAFSHPAAFVCS